MGIPCSSKNMFPSNIQGLPTWYQIRASADGYLSRKDVIDVMVMFNDATAAKDIYRVRDGGVILFDDSTPSAGSSETRWGSVHRFSGEQTSSQTGAGVAVAGKAA